MKKIIGTCLLLALISAGYAQKMKVLSGDFDFLKGLEQVKVTMDFSEATFYNENMSEDAYIERRVKELNEDKPGEGTSWQKDWASFRDERFLDKLTTIATESSKKANLTFSKDADATYTLIVKVTWIYPGWFGGIMKQPAKVSTLLNFVETANPSNVVLSIQSEKALGDIAFVGIPNTNDRIAEGFAKTGKSLAQLIDKKNK